MKYRPSNAKRKLLKIYPCCIWCGFVFYVAEEATIEHLLPVAFGGGGAWGNLALACGKCNRKRGAWYYRHAGHLLPRVAAHRAAMIERRVYRMIFGHEKKGRHFAAPEVASR